MTMDTEAGRETKTHQPKRSFDVAFLTGANETPEDQQLHGVDDEDDDEDDEQLRANKAVDLKRPDSDSPRSAFKKVSKSSDTGPAAPAGPLNQQPVDLSLITAPPYYHPFAFPAIATTLSLQLLQHNSKGLAMSLFGNPAVAAATAAAAAMAGHGSKQSQSAARPSVRPDGANNLIEDYIRASLYHQHQQQQQQQQQLHQQADTAGKDFGAFHKARQDQESAFNPAGLEHHQHRLARPTMAPPPPPPVALNPVAAAASSPAAVQPAAMGQLPSLAASLASAPSQNVCAKCNLSFRMTSDLVYHMRSQHRRDSDPVRQKRQEKLRCPVCGENFRERHHLTRHMTSHEDRETEVNK